MIHLCLHPDALVLAEAGFRANRSLQIGDRVFAGDGAFHCVEHVSAHPYVSEHLYRIVAKGGNADTLASDNHPFLIWRPAKRGQRIIGGDVGWVRADEIRVGDYTLTPILAESDADPFPELDEDDWFLFGLYLAQGHLQSAGHGVRRYPAFSLHKRRQDLMERIWAKWPRAREYDHNDYRPEPTSGTVVTAFDGEAGLPFGSSSCVRSHSRSNVFQSRCGCDGQLHGHQSAPIRQHCQSAVVRNCHLLRLERPALNRVPLAARAVTNPCRVLRPEQNTLEARHPVPAALSRREGERRRAFSGDLEEGCFCQGQQFTLDLSDPLDLFGKDRQSLGSSGAGVDGVDLLLVEERADDPPTLVTV